MAGTVRQEDAECQGDDERTHRRQEPIDLDGDGDRERGDRETGNDPASIRANRPLAAGVDENLPPRQWSVLWTLWRGVRFASITVSAL